MTTPKPKDWKVIVSYIDPRGDSWKKTIEGFTYHTAKGRANTICEKGCWIKPDPQGAELLVPPHCILGVYIKKMEETVEFEVKPKPAAERTRSRTRPRPTHSAFERSG